MEHDFGEMDPRLIKSYESLKKLAMQLGGQQAFIFEKCQLICEEIRGQPVEQDPYGASSPKRNGFGDDDDAPRKDLLSQLECQYGLGSDDVITTIKEMNSKFTTYHESASSMNRRRSGSSGVGRGRSESTVGCVIKDKQLTGMLCLRLTDGIKILRKWTDAFFVLNNERFVVFKDDRRRKIFFFSLIF